jgi:hypothetical protein
MKRITVRLRRRTELGETPALRRPTRNTRRGATRANIRRRIELEKIPALPRARGSQERIELEEIPTLLRSRKSQRRIELEETPTLLKRGPKKEKVPGEMVAIAPIIALRAGARVIILEEKILGKSQLSNVIINPEVGRILPLMRWWVTLLPKPFPSLRKNDIGSKRIFSFRHKMIGGATNTAGQITVVRNIPQKRRAFEGNTIPRESI